jgi:hypothetical protein
MCGCLSCPDSVLLCGAACCYQVLLPPTVPASLAYLSSRGCYLLDNGQLLVLWLGREVQPAWLEQVRTAAQRWTGW